MIVQISAGQGPRECELAVTKLFAALQKEFGGMTVLSRGPGSGRDTCTSITFSSRVDLGFLEGSVQWICESPYRKGYKRKNWFVDVSVIPEAGSGFRESGGGKAGGVSREKAGGKAGEVCREKAGGKAGALCREGELRFERFHCGGKGGQNVNKVETGVRLVHLPTGISVTSTEERSQFMNRQKALKKLEGILEQLEEDSRSQQKKAAWMEHSRLERGNPVRIYKGMDFKRVTPT